MKSYELQACINRESNDHDGIAHAKSAKVLEGPDSKSSGDSNVGYGFMLEDKLTAASNSNNNSNNSSGRNSSRNSFAVESSPNYRAGNETEAILESLGSWQRVSDNPNPEAFKV